MTNKQRSAKMSETIKHARKLQHVTGGNHCFNVIPKDVSLEKKGSEIYLSPSLSKAGQFFLTCLSCKRSVFEDGTGSAADSHCQ